MACGSLCTAGLLASGDSTVGTTWATLKGLLLLQAIQILGLLVAGLLAGAGQRQGIVFGAVVGAWNGVLSVALPSSLLPQTVVTLVGQPILHTAFVPWAVSWVVASGGRLRSFCCRTRLVPHPRPLCPP